MNKLIACAALCGLSLAARRPVLAEDERDDDEPHHAPAVVRPSRDVACTLTVRAGARTQTASGVAVKLVVRNRSRRREPDVQLALYANAPVGTPLWTGTMDLRAHHGRTRRVEVEVPAGTTSLVAVAACEGDENPGNNISGDDVPGREHGDVHGGAPTPPPASAAVLAGAATYATNCASCHGADAKGTRSGPRVLGRSAHDVLEAMREGEDGMPRFPAMTSTDASNLAAFLRDPAAATQPTTPVPPPPSGMAPTYAGQVRTLLEANCTVCHTGPSSPAGVRLDTLAGAKANAPAALAAMQAGRMPPAGALPAATVQVFRDWIDGGKQP